MAPPETSSGACRCSRFQGLAAVKTNFLYYSFSGDKLACRTHTLELSTTNCVIATVMIMGS